MRALKKSTIVILIMLAILFSTVRGFYNPLFFPFMELGNHAYITGYTNRLKIDLIYIGKYKVMNSNDLVSYVWSFDRKLIGGQMKVESSYYTHAISKSRAIGLLQMKYPTSLDMGVNNLFDPVDNLNGAVKYLNFLKSVFGDEKRTIGAYYQGIGSVKRNGLDSGGTYYYYKVKKAQKKYKNSPVYSPYFYTLSFELSKNHYDFTFNTGLVYRKIELYGNFSIESTLDEIPKQLDSEIYLLNYPITTFAFGIDYIYLEGFSLLFRTGLPWNQTSIKIGKRSEFSQNIKLKSGIRIKLDVKEDLATLGVGISIFNGDLFFNLCSDMSFGISFGL